MQRNCKFVQFCLAVNACRKKNIFFCNKRDYKKIVSHEDGRGCLRGGGSTHHYYFSEPVIASSVLHFMGYIIGLIIGSAVRCLFEGRLSCHSLVVKALGEELLKWDLGCFCQPVPG